MREKEACQHVHTIEVEEAGVHYDEGEEEIVVKTIRNTAANNSINKYGPEEIKLLKQLIEDDLNTGDIVVLFSEVLPNHRRTEWFAQKKLLV